MSDSAPASEWRARAARVATEGRAFVDGEHRDAASGETFPCSSPLTGEVVCEVAACDARDVDRAVQAARRAFDDGRWSRLAPRARRRALLAVAGGIRAARDDLAALVTRDCGKPIATALGEVDHAADCFEFYAEAIDKVFGEVAPAPDTAPALVTREPLGVIGAVVPWNHPLGMPAWKIAPALAAGNAIVVKPAEQAPLAAIALARIVAEAGVPDGVFNVVPGFGETAGAAIGRHMDVDGVAFTGSTAVGKLFLRYAGESNMKRVSLECGGKSPNVVLADAPDLERAAVEAAAAAFVNQGQVCSAGSRVIVEASVHDAFVERLVAAAEDWQPADPFDPRTRMGAIIDEAQLARVAGHVGDGAREGAELLAGGRRALAETGGTFLEPTVLGGVRSEMRVAQEEIFGPVVCAIAARDVDDALRIANDTMYGLAAAVWTRDVTRAHRVARALRAGTVWVNCYNRAELNLPFGGYKQSGIGRDKSLHALDQYTQLKTTWVDLSC